MENINTANTGVLVGLDEEWIELMIEAKNLGMELEVVRDFLRSAGCEAR